MRILPQFFNHGVRSFLIFLIWLIFSCVLFWCCDQDNSPLSVDFNKTVSLQHPSGPPSDERVLRVAVEAMVSPQETFIYYRQLLDYLGKRLGLEAEADAKNRLGLKLVAAPEIHGNHFYRSYLIVGNGSSYHELQDLRGKVFAFTDPDSLTGKRVPAYWIAGLGDSPETFFLR